MKKLSTKILISVLAAVILLAPVGAGLKIKETNAQAGTFCSDPGGNKDGTSICIEFDSENSTGKNPKLNIVIKNTKSGYISASNQTTNKLYWILYDKEFHFLDEKGKIQGKPSDVTKISSGESNIQVNKDVQQLSIFLGEDTPLKENSPYFVVVFLSKGITGEVPGAGFVTLTDFTITSQTTFRTGLFAEEVGGGGITSSSFKDKLYESEIDFGCSAASPTSWFKGCVASLLYYVIFVPLAEITKLAAKILDFFIYYSTNSSSYTAAFVEKGWAAVRDVVNVVFIIALLYIAVKTVLGLNVSNNKKLISMVIIIALVINFSLFATKVVIDASNILAKVFYNNITPVDEKGNPKGPEDKGEKSISVGLTRQFNPTTMFNSTGTDIKNNVGLFVTITLLSIALMGYMIYIFLSVALLFVARVVSLWISMIFSPIAFISYTIPIDIPGFGHKDWWKNLIENAMLAPLFIFMLYIIIMFGDFFKIITYDVEKSTDLLDAAMKTFIPFGIIFVLLQKAKKIAVRYSGEIGSFVNKVGAAVGGVALGAGVAAVTGGTGLALRGTLGRVGAATEKSGALKALEAKGGVFGFGAARLRDLGKFAGGASFDARNIKVAGKSLSSIGPTAGKGQQGGFVKASRDKVERRQKRAEELKVGENEKLKQDLNRLEEQKQGLLRDVSHDLELLEGRIKIWRERASDASRAVRDGYGDKDSSIYDKSKGKYLTNKEASEKAQKTLEELKTHQGAIRDGRDFTPTEDSAIKPSDVGKLQEYSKKSRVEVDGKLRSLNDFDAELIPQAHHHIEEEERERAWNYADKITKWNWFKTNREASNKVRMGVKIEDKGGGHH